MDFDASHQLAWLGALHDRAQAGEASAAELRQFVRLVADDLVSGPARAQWEKESGVGPREGMFLRYGALWTALAADEDALRVLASDDREHPPTPLSVQTVYAERDGDVANTSVCLVLPYAASAPMRVASKLVDVLGASVRRQRRTTAAHLVGDGARVFGAGDHLAVEDLVRAHGYRISESANASYYIIEAARERESQVMLWSWPADGVPEPLVSVVVPYSKPRLGYDSHALLSPNTMLCSPALLDRMPREDARIAIRFCQLLATRSGECTGDAFQREIVGVAQVREAMLPLPSLAYTPRYGTRHGLFSGRHAVDPRGWHLYPTRGAAFQWQDLYVGMVLAHNQLDARIDAGLASPCAFERGQIGISVRRRDHRPVAERASAVPDDRDRGNVQGNA